IRNAFACKRCASWEQDAEPAPLRGSSGPIVDELPGTRYATLDPGGAGQDRVRSGCLPKMVGLETTTAPYAIGGHPVVPAGAAIVRRRCAVWHLLAPALATFPALRLAGILVTRRLMSISPRMCRSR